jgi:hypothetical protein
MKRVAFFLFIASWFVPLASAQDRMQAGVYADYFRISQTDTNQAGLGVRVGFKAFPYTMMEGEMSYDFAQAFNEGFTDTGTGTISVQRTNMRVLHGLVGPKFEPHRGGIRPFFTVKAGFVNFRLNDRPATVGTFLSSVENLRSNNVSGVLYPGGGLEGHLGPVGLRLDVGDEIYFSDGAHHNLRVAFGPFLPF